MRRRPRNYLLFVDDRLVETKVSTWPPMRMLAYLRARHGDYERSLEVRIIP